MQFDHFLKDPCAEEGGGHSRIKEIPGCRLEWGGAAARPRDKNFLRGRGGRPPGRVSVSLSVTLCGGARGGAKSRKSAYFLFFTKSSDIGMQKREKCENIDFLVIFMK